MAFKLLTEDEPLNVKSIVAVIYGEPGIGKTSLAFTTHKPILEDYDDGVKRCVNRKTALLIEKWEDAIDFHKSKEFEEFAPKTLVIDTGGSMLDRYIASYVIRMDAKNGRSGGEVSLQGYGAMKTVFNAFINDMRTKGINLIFICHTETQKEGDSIKYIPKMTGGSYDIMMACADLVGYMESRNNKRTIDFNSTDRHFGKNTAEIPFLEIPHYTDPKYASFMQDVIDRTITRMMEQSEAQKQAIHQVEEYQEKVAGANIDQLEIMLPEAEALKPIFKVQVLKLIDEKYLGLCTEQILKLCNLEDFDHNLSVLNEFPKRYHQAIKAILWKRAKELNFGFDEKTGKFIKSLSAPESSAPPVAPTPPAGQQPPTSGTRNTRTKKEPVEQPSLM